MILVGRAGGRLRIEYAKSRRALRFWLGDPNEVERIDLTLADFCDRLGIERYLIGGYQCFILLGGPLDAFCGGQHGLLRVFDCPGEARECFIARRTKAAEGEWGLLIAIDEVCAVRTLAWFGTPPPGRRPATASAALEREES